VEKNFDFAACEKRLNELWLSTDMFRAVVNKNKKPYTIIMPPPNITSRLHIGHAFGATIMDAIIRLKRMQGYETLLLPGADHAAIATEAKVAAELAKQGIKKTDLTPTEFMAHIESWYEKYTQEICGQFKRLGLSCDWTRFSFTMDDHNKAEVIKAFNKLKDGGYVYQGTRMINWCPVCHTSLSDEEVEHKTMTRPIWTVKYGGISVATTRPETMFGDVAVAVHPNDKRYADLIGKTVPLPLTNRQIPVIADESVDMTFGTGAVKITPAHDRADNEVGLRHKLDAPIVIDENGILVGELTGKYAGLNIMDARAAVAADLEAAGLIIGKKQIESSIGECYRCATAVEPAISKQWFVKMKELAQPAIDALNNGLTLTPKKFGKIYLHWLNNIKDWCISRQLFSGHRIPVDGETDVLDTWFSSALWPFSTLNGNKEDFDYFYPTQTLVTAYEIIFFWVIRMVFSGIYHTGKLPFNTVVLTGLVRDEQGRKMSKSLGNGIDPIEIIDEYGADVLRLSLISGTHLDRDPKYSVKKATKIRNFTNKIWNSVKFAKAHEDNTVMRQVIETAMKLLNPIMPYITQEVWEILGNTTQICFEEFPTPIKSKEPIILELNKLIKKVTKRYEKFDFGVAANEIQQFYWFDFCDKYIEECKPKKPEKKAVIAKDNKAEKIAFYKNEIARGEKLLGNEGFVKKAPQKLIQEEKEKLDNNKKLLYNLTDE
jgi:valyl-tRNA synthetase